MRREPESEKPARGAPKHEHGGVVHDEFADQSPMTVTGKPQKFRMREIAAQKLGSSA